MPNLIGYVRIALGIAAFSFAREPASWRWFFWLYFVSYALDAVDGVAARALGQTSRLGALLDMMTDRAATAGLLAALAALYPQHAFAFTLLLMLDVVSHWAQMFASLSAGARSHKVREGGLLGGYRVLGAAREGAACLPAPSSHHQHTSPLPLSLSSWRRRRARCSRSTTAPPTRCSRCAS